MFYQVTITAIRNAVGKSFPSAEPKESLSPGNEASNLLWMTLGIEGLNRRSVTDATKAGRWIGWMLCKCEDLGFWENAHSRELIREDVRLKNDLPR